MTELATSSPVERYGRYQLIEQIGRGGMAEVFRAVADGSEGFRRVFVIKRIRPEKSDSPEFIQMFCDEARISALLNHPNIVQVYDFGQIAGSYFMAMEYLAGKDLSSVLRALRAAHGSVPPPIAAHVAREVAMGLHHAHTLVMPGGTPGQIVHRDVTPSNVMVLRTGAVKILDFGIAKAAAMARQADTQNGRVKGKLAYLSPEQVRAEDLDGRADVFALGVVLWEMLTGQRLFPGENEFQTMRNVLVAPVPKPSSKRPDVPAALDAVVARALERDPPARYQSAQAMAEELERYLHESPCSRQAIPSLLQTLFGDDQLVVQPPPPVPLEPIGSASLAEMMVAAGSFAPVPAEIAPAADASVGTETAPPTLVRARVRRRAVAVGAALTLAVCFAWAARHRARRAVVTAARPAAVSAREVAAARPPPPAASASVVVTLESTPAGADVADEAGAILGTTPLELPLPRSSAGRTLTLLKPGFASSVHTVVPDRSQTLRAALEPVEPEAAHASHHMHQTNASAPGRVTIDPFR
jgi:serine/threonine-protein kinase